MIVLAMGCGRGRGNGKAGHLRGWERGLLRGGIEGILTNSGTSSGSLLLLLLRLIRVSPAAHCEGASLIVGGEGLEQGAAIRELEARREVAAQRAEAARTGLGGDATVAQTCVGHLRLLGELGNDGGRTLRGATEHVDLVRVVFDIGDVARGYLVDHGYGVMTGKVGMGGKRKVRATGKEDSVR